MFLPGRIDAVGAGSVSQWMLKWGACASGGMAGATRYDPRVVSRHIRGVELLQTARLVVSL